ncbi:hypothetical protein [Cryptosporangium minutisporangium]|uniref:hypothetical protein n=1 Tax=Cryptosporangium minutisporangium TaxID=113569 RepID=UPI0031EF38DC
MLLALQDLTTELTADGGDLGAQSENEARLAIAALLTAAGAREIDPAEVLPDDAAAMMAARRLLRLSTEDPDTARVADDVLSHPPGDDQMSLELAVAGAVVLGALIGWLQTKVHIRITRVDGKTEFEFEARKAAASPRLLQTVASTVSELLGAPPGPPPPA